MNVKENIIDDNYPVHFYTDLHNTICGTGWLQGANYIEAVTCPKCLEILRKRDMATNELKVEVDVKNLDSVKELTEDLKHARELLQRVQDAITYKNEAAAFHGYYGLPHGLAAEIATFLDDED